MDWRGLSSDLGLDRRPLQWPGFDVTLEEFYQISPRLQGFDPKGPGRCHFILISTCKPSTDPSPSPLCLVASGFKATQIGDFFCFFRFLDRPSCLSSISRSNLSALTRHLSVCPEWHKQSCKRHSLFSVQYNQYALRLPQQMPPHIMCSSLTHLSRRKWGGDGGGGVGAGGFTVRYP